MKKRSLLALVMMMALSFTLVFTGCSKEEDKKDDKKTEESSDSKKDDKKTEESSDSKKNADEEATIVGDWKATWDMTDMMTEELIASMGDESLADLVEFDTLAIEFDISFDDNNATISVDEESVDTFVENIESGMVEFCDVMLEQQAEAAGVSADEVLSEMGYDHDAFVEEVIASMDLEAMAEEMVSSMYEEATSAYEIKDDSTLVITDPDGTQMEWDYELDGDNLTITFEDEESGMEIVLEGVRK